MACSKSTILVLCLGLSFACGPEGQIEVQDSEGDSEGSGSSDTGGSATTPNPTSPGTMTNASMSGSATTTEGDTDETGPVVDEGSGPETDTTPPPETSDTGECPFGSEGCLCDVGAQCDEGLDCTDEGICVAPPTCRPIDTDPHDDEGSALPLPELGCGDGMDLGVIGTIEGPEVDWYTFFGNDAGFCPEQPGAIVSAAVDLEVCVFIECASGADLNFLNCGGGSSDATSPDGREGCCGLNAAVVEGYDCGGFGGKDVDVYLSVGSGETICEDYSMEYAF